MKNYKFTGEQAKLIASQYNMAMSKKEKDTSGSKPSDLQERLRKRFQKNNSK